MTNQPLWERLLEALDTWTSATETEPGQIEVALPDSGIGGRCALIMMTPDEWEDMAGVMWGNFDDAVQDVKRTLQTLELDQCYVAYSEYRLEPSTQPTLPEPDEPTPDPGGQWVTSDGEGRVKSRFADWIEPDGTS